MIRVMVGAVVMLAEAVTFDRERRIDIIDYNIAVGIVMVCSTELNMNTATMQRDTMENHCFIK